MSTTTSTPAALTAQGLSERELAAWHGLLRSHAFLVKRLDAELEQACGLPLTSLEVLRHLQCANGARMRMCDLACSVMLSRSGLTRLVDRLERDGLLCRVSCVHDARGSYASLTDAGRARLESACETYLRLVRELFLSRFDAAEQRDLVGFWERIAPAAGGPCGCD
jgi:DNA-binding MarR family transcriptional regulator